MLKDFNAYIMDNAKRRKHIIAANEGNAIALATGKIGLVYMQNAGLGNAINITKTTACHAISYPITSYFNVPHGHAVALTIAPMIVYNSQVTKQDLLDKRGVDYVKKYKRNC